jgi:Predicted pPIWI-associating nuclease
MSGANAVDGIRDLDRELVRLRKSINAQRGKQLQSLQVRARIKEFVQTYFRVVRPQILRIDVDANIVDACMQHLLANKKGATSQYKASFAEIKDGLGSLEIRIEQSLSDFAGRSVGAIKNPIESRIQKTLSVMLPATARSYEQIISDLSVPDRLSYRGTATELREVLRETLDYLAPNKEVEASTGFQLEKDRTKPTMAQKARYILRQRGIPKNSIDAPKKAIEIVEDTVSSFVRSTYDRGSIDTHTSDGISKPQVDQLKMYVDSVLCELLEIHSQV